MKYAALIFVEALCCLFVGCEIAASLADNGAFVEPEFVIVDAVKVEPAKIEPTPDPISVDDLMPVAPVPHPDCRCASCKCEPACVGACAIETPAEVKAAPQMKCSNGQCYPVRRGLFGWRR
jgi:hypothetical protein